MIRYILISFMLASSALGVTPGDYWIQQFNNAGTKNIQIDLGAGGNNQVPFQDGSGTWGLGALPNANLAHSSTTINGTTISLGASGTITATSTGTLTIGTHLTGGSYNGSAGVTIATDAVSTNTTGALVARDGSGNFSAGTITASLSGNASTVTTNANLTGPITSVGNATSIASQTGTGSKFVVDNSPTLITPVLGVASATSINGLTISASTGTLTISNLKTLTLSNTLTFTGTDGSSVNFGTGGTVLYGNQSITLSGDVTGSGTTAITTTLANIPTATPAVGTILHTNIVAPSSPASGKVSVYSDSTDLRFHDKNAAGSIGTTVVSDTGATHNFLTAVSAAGAISKAQPAFTDVSGSVASTQMPALTGDVTTSAGAVATTLAMVNSNVGSFTSANITVNAKGLVTAAANGSGGAVSGTLVWISTVQMKGTMSTSSTSFTDITDGTSPLTITYTPTSSSDKFIIVVSLSTEGTSSNAIAVRLIRDSTPIDIGDAAGSRIQATAESYSSNGDHAMYVAPHYLDSPGDTSSHTWKVQIECSSAGTAVVNRGSTDANSSSNARTASTMTLYKVTP